MDRFILRAYVYLSAFCDVTSLKTANLMSSREILVMCEWINKKKKNYCLTASNHENGHAAKVVRGNFQFPKNA